MHSESTVAHNLQTPSSQIIADNGNKIQHMQDGIQLVSNEYSRPYHFLEFLFLNFSTLYKIY
jgi:hypothetical protein